MREAMLAVMLTQPTRLCLGDERDFLPLRLKAELAGWHANAVSMAVGVATMKWRLGNGRPAMQ